jgi:hypothetical protein
LTELVNVGFIKSVSPILDFDIVDEEVVKPELQEAKNANSKVIENEEEKKKKNQYHQQQQRVQGSRHKIKKGMKIKLDCDFRKGPVLGDPQVIRFANYERFFC